MSGCWSGGRDASRTELRLLLPERHAREKGAGPSSSPSPCASGCASQSETPGSGRFSRSPGRAASSSLAPRCPPGPHSCVAPSQGLPTPPTPRPPAAPDPLLGSPPGSGVPGARLVGPTWVEPRPWHFQRDPVTLLPWASVSSSVQDGGTCRHPRSARPGTWREDP